MTERRGRKELVELDKTLASVEDITPKLRADLIDLDELAWAQKVGEHQEGSSKKAHWYLSDVGDPRAKQALRELDRTAAAFLASAQQTRNLFVGGPGVDPTKRGTMLGDETGAGAEAEHAKLVAKQHVRRSSGIYTPNRTEPQPRVPGARRR